MAATRSTKSESSPQGPAESAPAQVLERGATRISVSEAAQVRELPDLMHRIHDMGLTEEYVCFRERYLGWRKGKHMGASGELMGGELGRHNRGWGFWYPTVQVWQWRRTLSYWISVTFFEGSLFFTISSFLWCYPEQLGQLKATVTTWGYIAGKVNFFACTYMMCLETINLSNAEDNQGRASPGDSSDEEVSSTSSEEVLGGEQRWRFWPFHVRTAIRKLHLLGAGPWPYYASALYLVGVLTFGVGLVADFMPRSIMAEEVAEITLLVSFLLGSLFFTLGGAAECVENDVFTTCNANQGWWGALFNLLGGLGFLTGAIIAFFPGHDFASMLCYAVGSAVFALGAGVMIVMWKDEQFGLTFLAVLNQLGGPHGRPVVETSRGKVEEEDTLSRTSALFIMIYALTATLSVYDFMINIHWAWETERPVRALAQAFNALLPCVFAHFMLALTSGVHRSPKRSPFRELYIACRYIAVLMCINNGFRFVDALRWQYYHVYLAADE